MTARIVGAPDVARLTSLVRRTLKIGGTRRSVPAAVLNGTELIHLGGGESIPCPDIGTLPLAPSVRRMALGSPSLALPPSRVHVLRDVIVCPGSGLVIDSSGQIVAESMTHDMARRVDITDEERRAVPQRLDGTIAVYRSPWRSPYHTLIDHLPRAALLAHPAMRRLGQITLVHDGELSGVERHLLSQLLPSNVRLMRIETGRSVTAERVVLPGYVTRPGAGAIPSWYRRWIDREAAAIDDPVGPGRRPGRRLFLDRFGKERRMANRAQLLPLLEHHRVEPIDPESMEPEELILAFRDAELVIGVTGSGLANAVFSRSAHVVELMAGQELLPRIYYLTAAKGLGYTPVSAPPDRSRLSAEQRMERDVLVDPAALERVLEAHT